MDSVCISLIYFTSLNNHNNYKKYEPHQSQQMSSSNHTVQHQGKCSWMSKNNFGRKLWKKLETLNLQFQWQNPHQNWLKSYGSVSHFVRIVYLRRELASSSNELKANTFISIILKIFSPAMLPLFWIFIK